MAGNSNSGRRGRQTNANEDLRLRVLDKAWVILEQSLDDPNLDKKEKREIAKALAVKSIPQQVDANVHATVTEMPAIQKDFSGEAKTENRIAEFLIGSPHTPQDT